MQDIGAFMQATIFILYRIEAMMIYVVRILHERMDVRMHVEETSGPREF